VDLKDLCFVEGIREIDALSFKLKRLKSIGRKITFKSAKNLKIIHLLVNIALNIKKKLKTLKIY